MIKSSSKKTFSVSKKGVPVKLIPLSKLIPSLVTIIGLIVGISSIKFALDGKWEIAVYCILSAVIIDGLDGRIARFLDASSHFGAELDSLCDLVNFGLCPALIIYLWSFQQYEYGVLSWAAILLFVACMAIRLARFNTNLNSKSLKSFFTGVPAPAGAILVLFPLIIDFGISEFLGFTARNHTLVLDIYIIFVSLLLPSKLSTFSAKGYQIKPKYIYLSMIASAAIIIFTFIYTWYAIPIFSVLYLLSIPYTEYQAREILAKECDDL